MANSSASGQRSAFSQTCNLLSQYVKEKKSIGDLSLGMLANGDDRGQNDGWIRPMNLFPTTAKSMDIFPQSREARSAELTIFYAGQVIVVNDFPANKAKEIMELANRGAPVVVVGNNNTNTTNDTPSPGMKNVVDNKTTLATTPSPNKVPTISLNNGQQVQEPAQQSTPSIITDLPIARKASLHRFLEKRKDRIKARTPYNNTSKPGDDVVTLKADESQSWLGLAAAPPA